MAKSKPVGKFTSDIEKGTVARLCKSLSAAIVRDKVVHVWEIGFSSFRQTIVKYFGQWLDEGDINGIVVRFAYSHIKSLPSHDYPDQAPLSEFLDSTQISVLAVEIVAFLKKLPFEYEFYFPLPNVVIFEEVKLSSTISLTLAENDELVGGPSAGLAQLRERTYLKVKVLGYVTNSRSQSAMREAIAMLKRSILVGVVKKIFIKPYGIINRGMFLNSGTQAIFSARIESAGSSAMTIPLGLGMSRYLTDLIIRFDGDSNVISGPNKWPVKVETLTRDLIAALANSVNLMTDEGLVENTKSLRSAFEWAFDALADDEIAPSFIKTCIALEAALVDADDPKGGITERLADRCAYLLGRTPIEREKVRVRMREVYDLRSQLVHGKQTNLSHQDHVTEYWGKDVLEDVLEVELTAIEFWWQGKLAEKLRSLPTSPL